MKDFFFFFFLFFLSFVFLPFFWKNSAVCPSSEKLQQDTDAFCFRHYPALVLIGIFCPIAFGCSRPTRLYFPNKLALCAVMKFISDFRRQQAGTRIVYLSLPQGPGSSSYTQRHQGPLLGSLFLKSENGALCRGMKHQTVTVTLPQIISNWNTIEAYCYVARERERERERERMSSICVFLSCSVVAALQKLH